MHVQVHVHALESTFWLSVSLIDPLLAAGGMLLVALGLTNTKTAITPTKTRRVKRISKETTIPAMAPLDKPVKPVSITGYYYTLLLSTGVGSASLRVSTGSLN